jgi:hypothetical protein
MWHEPLAALAVFARPPETAIFDSSAVRTDRSAAGARRGAAPRASSVRVAARQTRSIRSVTASAASSPSG